MLPGVGEMPHAVGLSPSRSEERADHDRQEGSSSCGLAKGQPGAEKYTVCVTLRAVVRCLVQAKNSAAEACGLLGLFHSLF